MVDIKQTGVHGSAAPTGNNYLNRASIHCLSDILGGRERPMKVLAVFERRPEAIKLAHCFGSWMLGRMSIQGSISDLLVPFWFHLVVAGWIHLGTLGSDPLHSARHQRLKIYQQLPHDEPGGVGQGAVHVEGRVGGEQSQKNVKREP